MDALELDGGRFVARIGAERIEARACVLAAGGFESNREWLRQAWGRNERGEWPADNFLIRGTRYNMGVLLKFMLDAGADAVGDRRNRTAWRSTRARALYDGGICTRIDCVSLGVVVNRTPVASTTKARLLAQALRYLGPVDGDAAGADCLFHHRRQAVGRFMPPVFPGVQAATLPELARKLGLDETAFMGTMDAYNRACRPGTFDHTALDDCRTEGVEPAKDTWARPIDTAPFFGYALRPGITFTYLGLKVDETAAVRFGGRPSDNLFVAGEMMAGNVLGKGYTAGVGMSIGTAFGRIAGTRAAAAANHAQSNGEVHAAA